MSDLERVSPALDEARRLLDVAEHAQPDGPLAAAKSPIVAVVRRGTWHQRRAVAALAGAVDACAAHLGATAAELGEIRRHLDAMSEGHQRFDERITNLEKRAARTEAMVATLATQVHELLAPIDAHRENGGGGG
jgi:septal ring factor EnvC (AmiA/AmiB activator)